MDIPEHEGLRLQIRGTHVVTPAMDAKSIHLLPIQLGRNSVWIHLVVLIDAIVAKWGDAKQHANIYSCYCLGFCRSRPSKVDQVASQWEAS